MTFVHAPLSILYCRKSTSFIVIACAEPVLSHVEVYEFRFTSSVTADVPEEALPWL